MEILPVWSGNLHNLQLQWMGHSNVAPIGRLKTMIRRKSEVFSSENPNESLRDRIHHNFRKNITYSFYPSNKIISHKVVPCIT